MPRGHPHHLERLPRPRLHSSSAKSDINLAGTTDNGTYAPGGTVRVTVSDGGTGDADGTADGRIVDPVGLASPAGAPAEPSAGGCSVGGTGGGPSGLAGSFGLLALFAGGLAARRLAGRAGRR